MTPIKRISRDPTEEMLGNGCDAMFRINGVHAVLTKDVSGIFQAMFDAAPDIETEAEKRAEEWIADVDDPHIYNLRTPIAERKFGFHPNHGMEKQCA
jgi:hypothetical protein